jgi:hypothetical protein
VAFLFSATLMTGVDARLYPYSYTPIERDDGDDHPWGGEQHLGPDPEVNLAPSGDHIAITGSITLDALMFKLFTPWMFDGHGKNYIITDRVVDDDTDDNNDTSVRNRISN